MSRRYSGSFPWLSPFRFCSSLPQLAMATWYFALVHPKYASFAQYIVKTHRTRSATLAPLIGSGTVGAGKGLWRGTAAP
jgi:hypothetical protein